MRKKKEVDFSQFKDTSTIDNDQVLSKLAEVKVIDVKPKIVEYSYLSD